MIELDNRTSLQIEESLLNTIAETLTNKEIELIITTNDEIQEINRTHRGIDKPTDVLSFPYENMPILGSIVIAQEFVEAKAEELGHSQQDEYTLLFIHGLLHLLGFDHEVDSGEMREEEKKLIEQFSLPKSLIVRIEG